MTVESRKNFLINILFTAVIFSLVYFAFRFLTVFLLPFLIGLIVTVIAQKPVDFISTKLHIKRGFVSVFLVVIFYSVILAAITGIAYGIYVPLKNLIYNYESYIGPILDFVNQLNVWLSNLLNIETFNISDYISISEIFSNAAQRLAGFVASLVASIPQLIISIIVTIVASCYIASDFTKIVSFLKNVLPSGFISKVCLVRDILFNNVFKIIRGYIIIMFITFCELCLGLWLIGGVDNLFVVAGIICIVDVLPVLGVGTVLIPWSVILIATGDFTRGILIAILYIVIVIIRNFIEPRIIGKQMGLHPLVTLICIFVGLRLFGIIGMFSVPLTVMVLIELQRSGKFDIVYYFAKNFIADEPHRKVE